MARTFAKTIMEKDPEWGTMNLVIRGQADGSMDVRREKLAPLRPDLQAIIEESQKA